MGEVSDLECLQWELEEHFDPGQPVEILIGIGRALSMEGLRLVHSSLDSAVSLVSPVEEGEGPWPHTLRLVLLRPQRGGEPLAAVLRQALESAGLGTPTGLAYTRGLTTAQGGA